MPGSVLYVTVWPVIDQVMARRLAEHRADAQRVADALRGDLEALRAERTRAERVVASLDRQIATIEQLVGVMTNLAPLPDDAAVAEMAWSDSDSPVVPEQRQSLADVRVAASVDAVRQTTRRSATYRDLVLPLLGQDPTRWWKAREVAEALGVSKVASLREALRGMAGRGLLEYESDDLYGSRYRALQPAAQPADEGAVIA